MIIEELRRIMPVAAKQKRLDVFLDPLNNAMGEFEINTPVRQSAFLAHLAHESGELCYMQELASGRAYNGREDLGNTKPEAIRIAAAHGSTPGPWWKGHGPIQITGYTNHLLCGDALGLDLLNDPLQITQPVHGCRASAWFWVVGAGLNLSKRAAAVCGVGCNLNDIADRGDFEATTLAINGGLNGLDDRQAYLRRAQQVLA